MFESARLKLTAWYLLIIMGISIVFSYAIYHQIDRELAQFELARQLRISRMQTEFEIFGIPPDLQEIDDSAAAIMEARNRIVLTLIVINLGIFVISGGAGYFLAGRTLKPIQNMLDDQNRFITDASHELRTPLTALKTAIEVNLREKKLTTAQVKEILSSNLEEVNTMQALTDDLILLAQQQKVQEVSFSKLDSNLLISQAISQCMPLARVKDIQLEEKGERVVFDGDKKSIQTLFTIFLENAIKYSPERTKVTIKTRKKDASAAFEIKDEGIGIEKDDLPRIFERFYRAEKSRTRSTTSGYGLGLSIAKKIVDSHSGDIRVTSEKGKGTTFRISLPLKQERITASLETRIRSIVGV